VPNLRKDFVERGIFEGMNISACCRKFGISRRTGYKWLERYKTGLSMEDMNRAPRHIPHKTSPEMEALVVQTRTKYPTWCGRTIKRVMENEGILNVPAASTITAILHRHKLITVEASQAAKHYIRFEKARPNDLWQVDFKGHYALSNQRRCFPLVFIDDCSRFNLNLTAKENECFEGVRDELLILFYENGLPDAILSDNGNPWGSNALFGGFTRFDKLLMDYDVLPLHGRPYHPQTQGKVERLNRTLLQDLLNLKGPFADHSTMQKYFDEFRHTYNEIRPHHSLGMLVPAAVYRKSERKMPEKIIEWNYSPNYEVRRVRNGYVLNAGKSFYLSEAFNGEHVGIIREESTGLQQVIYRNFCLCKYDLENRAVVTKKITRVYINE
jgi:transposase InsO family protein